MLNNKIFKKFIGGNELPTSDTELVLEDKPMKIERKEFLKNKLEESNDEPKNVLDIKQVDVIDTNNTNLEEEYDIQTNKLNDLREKHNKTVEELSRIRKKQTQTMNELEGYKIMNYYDLNNDKLINLKEIVTVLNNNKK